MPIDYVVSPDGMTVYARAKLTLSMEEVMDYIDRTARDPRILPGFSELFDESGVTEAVLTPDNIERIAGHARKSSKRTVHSKLAIICGPGRSFELARFYEKLMGGTTHDVIVFNDPDTAKLWLGIPREMFESF